MMQEKSLQIVSFDNPFPPQYGGVIEVFYKIKALYQLGYTIHLHCFVNQLPEKESILSQYVSKIYFYKNRKTLLRFFSIIPFSVGYRDDKELLVNLNKSNAPIIFESLKTTFLVNKTDFKQKIILRLHNIEHQYFLGISKSESNFFLKALFYIESLKYKHYESLISKFDAISTLSVYETNYLNTTYKNAYYTPVFHGNNVVKSLSEFGEYAIYNGDLRTADNRKAVLFLIEVFKEIDDYNLIIVASDGQKWVENLIKGVENIHFTKMKDFEHLKDLLSLAHINIMLSFQQSGTKLKLINALYSSRHCLINSNMIDDERILNLCVLANSKDDFKKEISILRTTSYVDFDKREKILNSVLNDEVNATSLMAIINNLI